MAFNHGFQRVAYRWDELETMVATPYGAKWLCGCLAEELTGIGVTLGATVADSSDRKPRNSAKVKEQCGERAPSLHLNGLAPSAADLLKGG